MGMATCKECFHCAACDMIYESCTGKNVSDLEFPNDAELCEYFKTHTKYVEVVRCKDCEHYNNKDINLLPHCTLSGITKFEDDFCSDGERREGE